MNKILVLALAIIFPFFVMIGRTHKGLVDTVDIILVPWLFQSLPCMTIYGFANPGGSIPKTFTRHVFVLVRYFLMIVVLSIGDLLTIQQIWPEKVYEHKTFQNLVLEQVIEKLPFFTIGYFVMMFFGQKVIQKYPLVFMVQLYAIVFWSARIVFQSEVADNAGKYDQKEGFTLAHPQAAKSAIKFSIVAQESLVAATVVDLLFGNPHLQILLTSIFLNISAVFLGYIAYFSAYSPIWLKVRESTKDLIPWDQTKVREDTALFTILLVLTFSLHYSHFVQSLVRKAIRPVQSILRSDVNYETFAQGHDHAKDATASNEIRKSNSKN